MIENIMRNVVDYTVPGKPVFICNPDPLSVWLNFILTFIATLQPERFQRRTLDVDPFAASLAALDYLTHPKPRQSKVNNNQMAASLTKKRFKVALSFPGEKRRYVSKIAKGLVERLGPTSIFYDKYFEAELAKPNLDLTLQKIYHEDSELIVIFICKEYEQKDWCGLEWRAIRDVIKNRRDKDIMPMRFDDTKIPGLFSIDGYIDLRKRSANETVDLICQRLGEGNNHP
ncbi:MAG TPA: TIR domain-containing protein [Blastocatellia bacterium]|nr:TIR domain-containing protein [Blastocatellia bacterium]